MPFVRLIYVSVPDADAPMAERIWKEDCAPLMIKQPGCLSEQLLKACEHLGEFISYSLWQDEQSIRNYLASQDHQTIKSHSAGLKTVSAPVVKLYEQV